MQPNRRSKEHFHHPLIKGNGGLRRTILSRLINMNCKRKSTNSRNRRIPWFFKKHCKFFKNQQLLKNPISHKEKKPTFFFKILTQQEWWWTKEYSSPGQMSTWGWCLWTWVQTKNGWPQFLLPLFKNSRSCFSHFDERVSFLNIAATA